MDNRLKILPELTEFAKKLALEAGTIVNQYFRSSQLTYETKSDKSPVTIADKLAEEKMRELIRHNYPDHGIIGEEFGEENSRAEFVWVLDPTDGTHSFMAGKLDFGVVIGLLFHGKPVLGVIYQPVLNEMLIGDNFITKHNGQIVRVRNMPSIKEATLLVADADQVAKHHPSSDFKRLTQFVRQHRHLGNCYGYAMLSRGLVDVMVDPVMKIWDVAGLVPIVRGAGGTITDYYGNSPLSGKGAIAASRNLHDQVLSMLHRDALFV